MTRVLLLASILLAACGVTPDPEEPTAALTDTGKADGGAPWCHANFTSTGGTAMVLDYQVTSQYDNGSGKESASPVWINVTNGAFHDGQDARAVVLSYSYIEQCGSAECGQYAELDQNAQVQLDYVDGRFTGLAPDLSLHYYGEGDDVTTAWAWELAIVVDGQWYKDPSSGNNLRTYPADTQGYCEQGRPLF